MKSFNSFEAIKELNRKISHRKSSLHNIFIAFQKVAAIIILPLLLFSSYLLFTRINPIQHQAVAMQTVMATSGQTTKVILPDNSTVWLSTGSKITFPTMFTGDERSVDVEGELFFDVVHDTSKPFHVKTPNIDIRVLGTSFNVVALSTEKLEEVVLENGLVDIYSLNGKPLITLSPDEKFSLDKDKRSFVKEKVAAAQYSAWKDGKLLFRNENMQQVARRLSRWYNAEVLVADQELEDYSFHATFMNEPLDEVLKLLAMTTPLKYREEKRTDNGNGEFTKRKIIIAIDNDKAKKFR